LPSIAQVRPSHGGALTVINTVRKEVGLPPIDIDELILATLGRIEDKLDGTQKEGPNAGTESGNEQETRQASQEEIQA